MSSVQAIVFDGFWTPTKARAWMKKHKFKPIKRVHKTTGGFLRYRLIEPKQFKRFFTKKTKRGISFIIGVS